MLILKSYRAENSYRADLMLILISIRKSYRAEIQIGKSYRARR